MASLYSFFSTKMCIKTDGGCNRNVLAMRRRKINSSVWNSTFSVSESLYEALCHKTTPAVRYEVLTAVNMPMLVLWVVTPFGLVGRYQRFGSPSVV
jgi:hypothetical protein